MLMNKFTAFEDAAMLNMHGLSNTVHGVGRRRGVKEERERIKMGGWKKGWREERRGK